MSTRNQWIKEYHEVCAGSDKPTLTTHPTWLIELAVRYGRLNKIGGLRTETEFKMARLTRELNEVAVRGMSEVWKYMVVRDIEDARARHKRPEIAADETTVDLTKMDKRPTAREAVLKLLREQPVRTDAQIIAAVNAATFHDGFNKAQLAWYRGKFKKGELKGQAGPEVVHEQA